MTLYLQTGKIVVHCMQIRIIVYRKGKAMIRAAHYNSMDTTMTLMCTGMCMCGLFVLPNLIAFMKSGTGVGAKP